MRAKFSALWASVNISDAFFFIAALNMVVFLIVFSFTVIALVVEQDFHSKPFGISVGSLLMISIFMRLGNSYKKESQPAYV